MLIQLATDSSGHSPSLQTEGKRVDQGSLVFCFNITPTLEWIIFSSYVIPIPFGDVSSSGNISLE